MFLPAVPSAPVAGARKAVVSNHSSISSSRGRPLSSLGSPTMSARSPVTPSRLPSTPEVIVIGWPVCSVKMPESVQSFRSAFLSPLPCLT